MMTSDAKPVDRLRHSGANQLKFWLIIVALGAVWLAYATHGFTRRPDWFSLAVDSAGPAMAYMPSQPKETTE